MSLSIAVLCTWHKAVRDEYIRLYSVKQLPHYFDHLLKNEQYWAVNFWSDDTLSRALAQSEDAEIASLVINQHYVEYQRGQNHFVGLIAQAPSSWYLREEPNAYALFPPTTTVSIVGSYLYNQVVNPREYGSYFFFTLPLRVQTFSHWGRCRGCLARHHPLEPYEILWIISCGGVQFLRESYIPNYRRSTERPSNFEGIRTAQSHQGQLPRYQEFDYTKNFHNGSIADREASLGPQRYPANSYTTIDNLTASEWEQCHSFFTDYWELYNIQDTNGDDCEELSRYTDSQWQWSHSVDTWKANIPQEWHRLKNQRGPKQ